MRIRSLWLVLLVLGAAIAAAWISLGGGITSFDDLRRVQPAYVPSMLVITAACVFMRFVRWQYLLRRSGVRVPTRRSLSVFLASLVGIAAPAYVGELLIRGVMMRRVFGLSVRVSTILLVAERLLDVAALAVMLGVSTDIQWVRAVMAVVVIGAWLVGMAAATLARSAGVDAFVVGQLFSRKTLAWGSLFSLAAWLPTALLVSLASASLQQPVGVRDGARIFTEATLFGGLTLMPAGIGATGSLAILELQNSGIVLAQGVLIVSLVRATTTGFALAVGAACLLSELWRSQMARGVGAVLHFDQIAQEYAQQFSPHVWNHLLERKIRLMASVLPPSSPLGGVGLDLGCGLGKQCLAMGEYGYRVVGLDIAHNLVRQARQAGVMATTGQAPRLPFRKASFDFVYAVGVLHHVPPGEEQAAAFGEARRVLKPGGLLIVHESNPRNPLFRFYMSYVFPLLKTIDEGTECWIRPQYWAGMDGMTLVEVEYFTFLPDFAPRFLMRPLLAFERRLEGSQFRPFAAHYMAVLRKDGNPSTRPTAEMTPVDRDEPAARSRALATEGAAV